MPRNLSDLQCPSCKTRNLFTIAEIWDGNAITFEVKHGQISEQGVIGDMGSPVKLIATCAECGHEWVLKGVTQIDDIHAERFTHFLHAD